MSTGVTTSSSYEASSRHQTSPSPSSSSSSPPHESSSRSRANVLGLQLTYTILRAPHFLSHVHKSG
eukprot:CAMPEP_0198716534 /NCGR_PEP_ID=MMETSP1471-20131121/38730_1 /TAXON_ID=41880 /ORGANISM="Pycnococcus provasolii, Strain RCC733" /LENGTH=65 /DNA_ID=CAMNT_0044477061 /DNA_START=64 /DNA_END=261 /DNA_ORIENTATION=+